MIAIKTIARWKDLEAGGYHDPGEVLTIAAVRAEKLVAAGCAEIVPEPKRKRGRPRKTKAARPSEDK